MMFETSRDPFVKRINKPIGFLLLAIAVSSIPACDAGKEKKISQRLELPETEIVEKPDSSESQLPIPSKESVVPEADWRQFRGPNFRSSVSNSFPIRGGPDQGIFWQQGLPGRGSSSPIVSGDRIFLTAYDGYGLTIKDRKEFKNLRHHLICLDRGTGKPIWQRKVTGTNLKQPLNQEVVRHGFASSTPVTDGENVYAFFGITGVFAFDADGNILWQRNLGLETNYFGSSASPVLYEDLLIVNASVESETIYALDKNTGAVVWKIPNVIDCWSMPVIGKSLAGNTEMIVSSKLEVNSYDPRTGKKIWHCEGIQDYVVSVPIIVDGICYLTGGKQKQTMAIGMGGKGDANDQKLWEIRKIGSNVSSPVYKNGRLFIFHDNGNIQVLDAETGEVITRQRTSTKDRPFASPLLAGEHLYMPFQDAGIGVFKADDECEEVAVNAAPGEMGLSASVVPCGNKFYFRGDKYIVCVGPEAKPTLVSEWEAPENMQVVNAIEPYNINPERNWIRRYLGFLGTDFDDVTKYLLMPYQSVITKEQTEKSREIILGEKPKYDLLRSRLEELQSEELAAAAGDLERFRDRWAALETDTNKLNGRTRVLVKKLFPDQQLQQHYKDAKAGIAHIHPDSPKRKK
jgi:outer membrane protein assembly factor BamB